VTAPLAGWQGGPSPESKKGRVTAMDQQELHLKKNIEETRQAMEEKINKIQGKVYKTVAGPKIVIDNLIETVEQAKIASQDSTLETNNSDEPVRRVIAEAMEKAKILTNIIEQVKRDPWTMLASGFMMGYVLGNLSPKRVIARRRAHPELGTRRELLNLDLPPAVRCYDQQF
jgi:hypothetical protein